jgi:formiminoglutamase
MACPWVGILISCAFPSLFSDDCCKACREKMVTIPKGTDLNSFIKTTEAKYVLLGIPEDIGIRANYGRPGAASAWESAIKSIANIQHNRFCKGSQILVLGQIDVQEQMNEVENLD